MAKKKSYKVGELCKELDIQPYVLRYWETEFPFLRPDKAGAGQRSYSEDELTLVRRIKELLYDEGYTIAGAKKKLEAEIESGGPRAQSAAQRSLRSDEPAEDSAAEAEEPPSASAGPDGDDAVAAEAEASSESGGEPADDGAETDPPSLDTAANERIETIARGLRALRNEAREVLELLQGSGD